ncbi:DUF72 domain-containing protein [Croceiramulus getboli]|nr:DUF72 domain-containing protein [Flavobacteriaceae bacterium YJPT1-3]
MKFGKVDHPEKIDFTLPADAKETAKVLSKYRAASRKKNLLQVYVGCAKWNRQELKGFYPRGTKDELTYYASQFNSIELNATFYRLFPKEQYETWYEKTPADFKFFPKIYNYISHLKRLIDPEPRVDQYLDHTLLLQDKLGTIFLQMHPNFQPKNFDRVERFVQYWPREIPLAMEFRHTDWFNNTQQAERLCTLLEAHSIANIITDTAGRRDLLHMRLTNEEAFIRFNGANHPTDYTRLDDWVDRLEHWVELGLQKIHFFVHQNVEEESPLLSAYFIEKLNQRLTLDLQIPHFPKQKSNFHD